MRPADAMAICFLRGFLLSSVLVLVLPVLFGVDGIWAVMAVTEMITLAVAIFFWKKASR